jgi:hypothetical protein
LAAADDQGGGVRLYRNRGDGTFAAPSRISFTGTAGLLRVPSIAASDFDGDGQEDLAAAVPSDGVNPGGRVEVLFNRAQKFNVRKKLPAGDAPWNLVAADLDRDGIPDVAVVDVSASTVQVFLDDGAANFTTPPPVSAGQYGMKIAAGDIDGDGATDLVVNDWGKDRVLFLRNATRLPRSKDANRDGIPDECQSPPFHRGDTNGDGMVDVSDGLCLLEYLFLGTAGSRGPGGGSPGGCLNAADANDDGAVDCSDPIFVLGWLFRGTAAPPPPGPPPAPCGRDNDAPGSPGDLGCESYPPCE